MSAEVIEVDFEARRLATLPLDKRADDLSTRIEEIRVSIDTQVSWLQSQRRLEQRHVATLKKSLYRERTANFPFGDDAVLAILNAVYAGEPVAAATVADKLYGRKATHSVVVRVGLVLRRLALAGRVQAAVPPTRSVATRWAPGEAKDA